MSYLAPRATVRSPLSVDPVTLAREVALARQMADEALERYREANDLWSGLDGQQRMMAASEGIRPPHVAEVLAALDLVGKLETRLDAIRARDSVPVQAILDFMGLVRGLIVQYVPEEDRQTALITAIQGLDIRSGGRG